MNASARRTSRAKALYKKSGHLPYYAESMFPPMELYEDKELHERLRDAKENLRETATAWFRQIYGDRKTLDAEIRKGKQPRDLAQQHVKGLPDDKRQVAIENLLDFGFVHVLEAGVAEPDRYYLKAMNCPHHHKLFAAVPRSYRDLPLRWRSTGPVIATSRAASCSG